MACSLGEEPVFFLQCLLSLNTTRNSIFESDLMCLRRSYNFLHLFKHVFDTEYESLFVN